MLSETIKMAATLVASEGDARRNVITESRVLHVRNICDFCTPRKTLDDLRPEDLFDDYQTATVYSELRNLVDDVALIYRTETHIPGSIRTGTYDAGSSVGSFIETTFPRKIQSPKTAFDKNVAHLTHDRSTWFNYQPFLDVVEPKIKLLVDEIGRLEKEQGRDFPSLP